MNWTVTKQHEELTIRKYLQRKHKFSKRMIKQIIHGDGEFRVNDIKTNAGYKLKSGDVLAVTFPEEKKGAMMVPEKMPLAIVYEDDAVLIINKPAGRATIPSFHHSSGTIANGVLAHYQQQGLPYTFHVVTRLDRNTSGLMLVAKHRWSHSILSESQKKSKITRAYDAIVEGHLSQKKGTINAPIGRKEGSIIERTVTDQGKHAITHYSVLKESDDHTLIRVQLETGRTHQIRVHFSHIGYSLAGDDLYGGGTIPIDRQALHCCHLSFEHPITGRWMDFTAEMADDMKMIVKA
ncbi:RluA family pseudouridine synthase [Lentibacillus sp. CBA3610]|uniref:RluA family pseudouridine synthase n=1 Tax=Lentibacillus sp. CBA3610 TaxID=2518176 RepID=UPI001595E1DF|nr:RluA family pseudouridine synthase [Lentibacillus sp. CBA3610]QKY68620.1 RluA family pseudouridine synthase [Lentibacillus sp. CBA3610]